MRLAKRSVIRHSRRSETLSENNYAYDRRTTKFSLPDRDSRQPFDGPRLRRCARSGLAGASSPPPERDRRMF